MEAMPLNVVILNAMPEAMVTIYLGLILIGIKPRKRRVFLAGVLQGVACYYIRKNFGFGVHILLQYFSFALLTWIIVKTSILAAFISNLIGLVIAILLESSIGLILPSITGLTFVEIMSRDWIRVICFMPYLFTMIILTELCNRHKFTLESEIKALEKIK